MVRRNWRLEAFEERLDAWIALEEPDDDLRLEVTAWVLTRFSSPYTGVRRAQGFDNLWFGAVPHSEVRGEVVTCSYWIFEREALLRCDSIATLSLPI